MQEQYQRSLTPKIIEYFESKWKTPYYLTKKMLKETEPLSINEVATHRKHLVTEDKENTRANSLLNIRSEYLNGSASEVLHQIGFLVKNIFESISIENVKNVKDLKLQLEGALERLEHLIYSTHKDSNLNTSSGEVSILKSKINEYKCKLKRFSSEQKQELYELRKQLEYQKSVILLREEENSHLRRHFEEERSKYEEIISQLKSGQRLDSYLEQSDYIQFLQGQATQFKDSKGFQKNVAKNLKNFSENSEQQLQPNIIRNLQNQISDTNKQLQELTNQLMQQQRTGSEQQNQLSDTIKKFEQRLNVQQENTVEDNDRRIQDLIEVNQQLQSQLLGSKRLLSELQQQLEQTKSRNSQLAQENQQLSQNRFDSESVLKLEAIIQNLNEKLGQCKSQLISEINLREAAEIECDERVRMMTKKLEDANMKVQQKENEVEELRRSDQILKNLQAKVRQQQSQFNELKLQLIDKQNQLESKQIELEKTQSQNVSLQKMFEEQQSELKQQLEENLRKYNSLQMKELKSELIEKDKQIKQLSRRVKSEVEQQNKFSEVVQSLKELATQGRNERENNVLISRLDLIKNHCERFEQESLIVLEQKQQIALLEEELAQNESRLQRQEIQIQMLRSSNLLRKDERSPQPKESELIDLLDQLKQAASQTRTAFEDMLLSDSTGQADVMVAEIGILDSSCRNLMSN